MKISPLNNKLVFWIFAILTLIEIGVLIFYPLANTGKILIGVSLLISVVNIPKFWKYKF
jgi:Cu/Ag efflux pump CusA